MSAREVQKKSAPLSQSSSGSLTTVEHVISVHVHPDFTARRKWERTFRVKVRVVLFDHYGCILFVDPSVDGVNSQHLSLLMCSDW